MSQAIGKLRKIHSTVEVIGADRRIMNNTLPGGELIEAGAQDLRYGRETIPALLVAIGAPRLRRLGLELPEHLPKNPEHLLYDALAKEGEDSAHTRYNALIRKLVSFERAAECVGT